MPFDSLPSEIPSLPLEIADPVLDLLRAGRDLLLHDGWCQYKPFDSDHRRCAGQAIGLFNIADLDHIGKGILQPAQLAARYLIKSSPQIDICLRGAAPTLETDIKALVRFNDAYQPL